MAGPPCFYTIFYEEKNEEFRKTLAFTKNRCYNKNDNMII